MSNEETTTEGLRDAANWAKLTPSLNLGAVPSEAMNLNVSGRRQVSPIQGFGKMWQKTYSVALDGVDVTPTEAVMQWKENFATFWPKGNRFYGPITGIAPGEVALLNLTMAGKMKLSTGVLVLYSDEESFTFMTPQGHMFAGFITFSAFRKGDQTVAQAQVLLRTNDPIYEVGMIFGGSRSEDRFWEHTLGQLARHLGVADPAVVTKTFCVDRKRQWRNVRNVWHNAAIRSTLYRINGPVRLAVKPFRKPPICPPAEPPSDAGIV